MTSERSGDEPARDDLARGEVDPEIDPEIGHVWRRTEPRPAPAPSPPVGARVPVPIVVAAAFLVLVLLGGGALVATGTWPPQEQVATPMFVSPAAAGSTATPGTAGTPATPATSAATTSTAVRAGAGTTTTTRPRAAGPIGPFGAQEEVRGRPMLSAELLVLFTDGEVIAEDPATEAVRWRVPCADAAAADRHALGFTDSLVVRCRDQVVLLDAADGAAHWRALAGPAEDNEVYVRDDVVVVGDDNVVRVVERATGEVRWTASLGYDDWLLGAHDGKVLVAKRGELVALETSQGKEVWRAAIDAFQLQTSADVLVAGLADGSLAAIDPPTGALRWQVPPTEAMQRASIEWVAGSRVVLHRDDGTFDGYDTSSGALVWSAPGDLAYEGVRYDGNRILAYDGDHLRVVDVDAGAVLLDETGKLRAYVAAGGTLVTLGSKGAVVRPMP